MEPKIVRIASELNPVSHVIFDMDGLLLATEELYLEAANQVTASFREHATLINCNSNAALWPIYNL